ncbi:MAG: hypothetical protein RLZZ50_1147 [Verrucomicrobiota bacterium]|jgi:hypothetical protein
MHLSHIVSPAALAALIIAPAAQAHVGWSGTRNFDTLTLGVTETSSDRNIGGAFGWADATDASFGDSHRNVFYRFVVGSPTEVSISVSRVNRTIAASGAGTQTGAHDYFLPAFSLYRIGTGIMPASTHDGAVASLAYLTATFGASGVAETFDDANTNGVWNPGETFTDSNSNGVWDSAGLGDSGKEGSYNALGDWKIYSDTNAEGDFRYIGHAADGTSANYGLVSGISGDGVADGQVNATFGNLVAGEYFIAVGGAVYADQLNYNASGQYGSTNTYLTYGVSVSVTAIPEPASFAALAGLGVIGMAAATRRRQRAA